MSTGACSVSMSTQSGRASARSSTTVALPVWLHKPTSFFRAASARLNALGVSSMWTLLERRVVGRREKHRVPLVDELAVLLGLGLRSGPLRVGTEGVPRLLPCVQSRIPQDVEHSVP